MFLHSLHICTIFEKILVHPNVIEGETKILYVDFLEKMGWSGVYDFLYKSIGGLKNRIGQENLEK